MTPTPLTGLTAATFTPMNADGSLNLSLAESIVEHLVAGGVSGLYVVGSTGEGPSLTSSERQATAEAFVAAARGRLPVVVQVGHNSLEEARALARHAQSIGASRVSATAPSYFKLSTIETLVECMARVAGGAPDLPFYYYHIPALVDVNVDLPMFLRKAGDRIGNFAGVKYTAPSIWEYQACLAVDDGRFDCLFGLDEMLLPALSVGARGAIGSTYNFAAPVYRRLLAAFDRGDMDEARACQAKAIAMIRLLLRYGGLPAFKAAMQLIGVDCGPVRMPLSSLSAATIRAMREDLVQVGYFEWIKAPTDHDSKPSAAAQQSAF
jgi:N-acetylneuraminate lyase